MSEETIKMLNLINDKIKESMEKHNINDDTLFIVPLGNMSDYGYLSNRMVEEILQLQQENKRLKEVIEEVREYLEQHGYDDIDLDCKFIETYIYGDLLQILDKAKENK